MANALKRNRLEIYGNISDWRYSRSIFYREINLLKNYLISMI